jgi:hypothetical protein
VLIVSSISRNAIDVLFEAVRDLEGAREVLERYSAPQGYEVKVNTAREAVIMGDVFAVLNVTAESVRIAHKAVEVYCQQLRDHRLKGSEGVRDA